MPKFSDPHNYSPSKVSPPRIHPPGVATRAPFWELEKTSCCGCPSLRLPLLLGWCVSLANFNITLTAGSYACGGPKYNTPPPRWKLADPKESTQQFCPIWPCFFPQAFFPGDPLLGGSNWGQNFFSVLRAKKRPETAKAQPPAGDPQGPWGYPLCLADPPPNTPVPG